MSKLVITDLRLEQFRKFDQPMRLAGLGPGLNLLSAPNETGKSTLKAALDAAFFTRHRVSANAAQNLSNTWNDAPPVVQVGFSLDGQAYKLSKRFRRRMSAKLLRPDGSLADGDAAEEELQTLLGFEPSRGVAKGEQLGIWGLLWVAQGDSFQPLDVSATARASLETSLAESGVASVVGGGQSNRVAQAVRADLARYMTAGRGQPTGHYARVLQEVKDAQAALDEASALKQALEGELEGLDHNRRSLISEEHGVDPAAEEQEITALRLQLGQAERHAQQLANAVLTLQLAERRRANAQQAQARRQELMKEGGKATDAFTTASQADAEAASAAQATAGRLATAQTAREQAVAARDQAQKLSEAATQRAGLQSTLALAKQNAARLEQALEAAREAAKARQQADALLVTQDALKKLRTLGDKRGAAAAARAAAATTLRFALSGEGTAALSLIGKPLSADAVVDLVSPATLDLGPLGSVRIEPGVQDAAALEQALADAEAALADALQRLKAGSIADAEAQAEQRRYWEEQAKTLSERAGLLAPEGGKTVASVAEALALVQAQIAKTEASLTALSTSAEADPSASEDRTLLSLTEATARLEQCRDAIAQTREWHALAQQEASHSTTRLAEARGRHESAANALIAARQAQTDEALTAEITEATTAEQLAKTQQAAMQTEASAIGSPDRIGAQIARLEKARDERVKRIARLREHRASLEASIRAKAERGPAEALEEATQRLAFSLMELARIQRDVAALQLLDRSLGEAQASLEQRYLAPVTAKLRPHLTDLFGDATVEMQGDFSLKSLLRAERAEDISQLSAGTREQLAILSRLAFAEVLAEQGQPVALLLDDALVFADDQRIQDMFLALERAAERFQVIVLSCRQRVFDGLGGAAQRRLTLEPCEAIEL